MLAAVWLCAASGAAQPRVEVPVGCGSEAELQRELARLLGSEAAAEALPERLWIRRVAEGDYALDLVMRGRTRSLRDPDCRTLFETAVVVAAAAVDPRVLHAEPGQPPAPAPEQAEGDEAGAGEPAAPAASDTSAGPAPWHGGVALGVGVALALLPEPAPWIELSGSLARGAFGLELAGRYLTPAEERPTDTHGVRIDGLGGHIAAFWEPWPLGRVQGAFALDRLSGQGLGSAVEDVSGSGVLLALALQLYAVPIRLGPTRLSLGISGHYALVRPRFEITGYGPVYRVPAFGGSGVARFGWEFH